MKLIFKAITSPSSGSELLKHTNFKQHFSGAHDSMPWSMLQPAIRQATRKYLIPFIGINLYNDIAEKFHNDTDLDDNQTDVLELMQDSLAHYVVYYAMPKLNISLASMGVQQNTSSDGSSTPANQWSFHGSRWDILKSADEILDQLLQLLEQLVIADEAYFDLYKNSDAYSYKKSSFFRTAAELDEYLNIQGSQRTFISMSRYLKKAEEKYILPIICTDQFNDIVTKYQEGTLADDDLDLFNHIRKTTAEWALYEAVPHLSIIPEADGFKVISSTDGMFSKRNLTNTIHEKAIQQLRYSAEENGKTFRAELLSYLYANADTFTLWKNSDCYIDDSDVNVVYESPDDTGAIGIF